MREPIMNGGPNPAPLNRRLARSMMTGNQQHDPIAARDSLLECAVDRDPCAVEIHAMQVEYSIWLDQTAAKLPIPGPVEGPRADRDGLRRDGCMRP